MRLPGRIRRVLVRGADVIVDGVFTGRRGYGRYVARAVAA
jgi:hypothetical protein